MRNFLPPDVIDGYQQQVRERTDTEIDPEEDAPFECQVTMDLSRSGTKSPLVFTPSVPELHGRTKTLGLLMPQRRLVPSRSLMLASPTPGMHKFDVVAGMTEISSSPVPFGMRAAPPVSPNPMRASPLPVMSSPIDLAWKRSAVAAPPTSPIAHDCASGSPATTPGLVLVRITLEGIHTLSKDVADTALRDLGVTDIIWPLGAPEGAWDIASEEFIGQRMWVFEGKPFDLAGYWCCSLQHVRLACMSSTLHVRHEELLELLGPSRLLGDDFRHLLLDRLLPFLWVEDGQLILLRLPRADAFGAKDTPPALENGPSECVLLEELLVVHEDPPTTPRFFALKVTAARVLLCEPGYGMETMSIGPLGVPKLCRRECLFPKLTFLMSAEEDVLCQLQIRLHLVGRNTHPGWHWRLQPSWRPDIQVVLEDVAPPDTGYAALGLGSIKPVSGPHPYGYADYEHEGVQVIYRRHPKRELLLDMSKMRLVFRACRVISLATTSLWVMEVLESHALSDFILHCVESGTCAEAFLPVDSIELYKAFQGLRKYETIPLLRRNLAHDLVQCVQVACDINGNVHITITRSTVVLQEEATNVPITSAYNASLFSDDECRRRLANDENILARCVRRLCGKRCEVVVLNDPQCLQALTCIHAFVLIVEHDKRFYALQVNDHSLPKILGPCEQHLLHSSGRIELVDNLARWASLHEVGGQLELFVEPVQWKATMSEVDHPVDVGSNEIATAKWEEVKEDCPQHHYILAIGAVACEFVLQSVRTGYHVYVHFPEMDSTIVFRIPIGGTTMPMKVYVEARAIKSIPFVFAVWETSFPHKIAVHVLDALITSFFAR